MHGPFRPLGLGFDGMKNFNQHFAFPKLASDFVPRVDMYQTEHDFIIKAELPGMNADDTLDIRVTSEAVTIRGEVKGENTTLSNSCCHQECYHGTFMRVLTLPSEVFAERATANYANGMLTVTVPKKPAAVVQGFNVKVNLPPSSK